MFFFSEKRKKKKKKKREPVCIPTRERGEKTWIFIAADNAKKKKKREGTSGGESCASKEKTGHLPRKELRPDSIYSQFEGKKKESL